MQKLFLVGSFLLVLVSCKNKKSTDAKEPGKIESAAVDPKKDSADISQQVLAFYEWYNGNYKKLMEFNISKSINKKDHPPYKIDWAEVDKMHAYIRSSIPYLGEEFLKNQKLFFQQADSAFKVDLEDDVPYGFDYDWYTNSQEDPQYLLDELKKSKRWVIKVDGDNATADIKGMYNDNGTQIENTVIKLGMKKENGVWKISKIGID